MKAVGILEEFAELVKNLAAAEESQVPVNSMAHGDPYYQLPALEG